MPFVIAIIAINLIRWILGVSNVVDLNCYEMIIMILESLCWCSIIVKHFNNEDKLEIVFTLFVIIVFITQVVQFIMGNFSVDGRIAAISLGPGATAEILIKYELWFVFCCEKNKKSYIPFVLSAIGLVLTGSRSNILSLAAIMAIFSFKIWNESKKTKTQNRLAFLYLLIAIGVIFLFFSNTTFDFINRFTNMFEDDLIKTIQGDSSYFGRFRSISGGFEIWKENPWGIACSIYDIEQRSFALFTMEYPHSGLLCYI